jgi:hypothetical protein
MAPPDRLEDDPLAAAVEVAPEVAARLEEGDAEDPRVVGSTVVPVPLGIAVLLTPYGGMLEYISHSASGAARGQSFARQIAYNCPSTGGEHRILYLAFIKVESVAASVSEKP